MRETLYFIDGEFTGLNPFVHEVISIGLVGVHQDIDAMSASFEVFDEREIKLKPENINAAEPVALEINGYTEEAWNDAYSQKDGLELVVKALSLFEENNTANMMLVGGHNIHYDMLFLTTACEREGVDFKTNKYVIDTHTMARGLLNRDAHLTSFSLSSLTEHFAVENKDAHTALSDAKATFEVYRHLMRLTRIK